MVNMSKKNMIELNQIDIILDYYDKFQNGDFGDVNKQYICDLLNDEFGYNFQRRSYEQPYKWYSLGLRRGEQRTLSTNGDSVMLERIARQSVKLKLNRKIVAEERKEVNSMLGDYAKFDLIPKQFTKNAEEYKTKNIDVVLELNDSKQDEYPIYNISDIHYGLISSLSSNVINDDILIERIRLFFEYVYKDILNYGYKKVGIFFGGDSIEGAGNLRNSQLLSVLKTTTQQALEIGDIIINNLEALDNALGKNKCKIDTLMVTASNHSELRVANSGRSEIVNDDLEMVVVDKVLGRFRDNKRFNFIVGDELLFEVNGFRLFMAHGHRHSNKEGLFKDLHLKYGMDYVIFGHWHNHTSKTKYNKDNCNMKVIYLPGIVGNTEYTESLLLGSMPSGLKITINKNYGLIEERIIPVFKR